jgi:hypothetical protein
MRLVNFFDFASFPPKYLGNTSQIYNDLLLELSFEEKQTGRLSGYRLSMKSQNIAEPVLRKLESVC